jgi:hypothetical protein
VEKRYQNWPPPYAGRDPAHPRPGMVGLCGANRRRSPGNLYPGWLGPGPIPAPVTPDLTLQNAAAPVSTLKLLLLALGAGAVVLLPSLLYLVRIFKREGEQFRSAQE